jgi:TatA/E family protein of Tat protein translocase
MNLGMPEMIFIFLLALIIFGPKKLPEIGRQFGRALAEFKRASDDFKSQLETEIRQIELADVRETALGSAIPGVPAAQTSSGYELTTVEGPANPAPVLAAADGAVARGSLAAAAASGSDNSILAPEAPSGSQAQQVPSEGSNA